MYHTSTPNVIRMLELKAGIVKAPKYLIPSPVKICAPALNHTGSCNKTFESQHDDRHKSFAVWSTVIHSLLELEPLQDHQQSLCKAHSGTLWVGQAWPHQYWTEV